MSDKYDELLVSIRTHKPEIEELHKIFNDHWDYYDAVYRMYHYSFKVFSGMTYTMQETVALIKKIKDTKLHEIFTEIVNDEIVNKHFNQEYNKNWSKETRPFVEAYFHCKYFIDCFDYILKAPAEESFNGIITSAHAAVLELYGIR